MKLSFLSFISLVLTLICTMVKAQELTLKIATDGDKARVAFELFSQRVQTHDSTVDFDNLTGVAPARELQESLEQEVLDLAIIPFSAFRLLARSPLLDEFLAEDAAGVRRAIESEVGAFEKHLLEQQGLRVLDIWHVSSTLLASTNDLSSVSMLQGRQVASFGADNQTFLAEIGAAPRQIAFAEVFTALERGALDTSAVPYDDLSTQLGFTSLVTNYVDRIYRPQLYAVVMTRARWEELGFLEQMALTEAARETGEALSDQLDLDATAFKTSEFGRGAIFATWDTSDLDVVVAANLATRRTVGENDGEALVRVAYASADPQALTGLPPDDGQGLPEAQVSVCFVTNRSPVSGGQGGSSFSARRNESDVIAGEASVRLRSGRTYGADLKDVAEIEGISSVSGRDAMAQMADAIAADGRPVVLFVHGYNNAFSDALRRAATIQQDIVPNAQVVSFTWPSDGSLLGYGYDASSVDFAEADFKAFMGALQDRVFGEDIHIIAHSMGTRLVVDYFESLRDAGADPSANKIGHLVFAASDIAQDKFRTVVEPPQGAPEQGLANYTTSVTVYSSAHDRALGLSHEIHNDKRLGLSETDTIFLDREIVSIDASAIDPARWYQRFSFATRHSYVFDKSDGVSDLRRLFAGESPDMRPGLIPVSRNGIDYWQMRGD